LTRAGEIVRVEEGGYSRLYPAGTSESERTLFVIVRAEPDRKILSSLATNITLSSKQLIDVTGLAKSTVSEHIADLVKLGVVKTRQIAEGSVVHELEEPERIRLLLVSQNPPLLKKASDRFIELWDF